MALPPPTGQPFAYQNSPATLGLYMVIARGPDYVGSVDMTTVTSVVVNVTYADAKPTTAQWTLAPIPAMTTADTLVAFRAYDVGDTAILGLAHLVATPYVGAVPLAPVVPVPMPIKGPSLT